MESSSPHLENLDILPASQNSLKTSHHKQRACYRVSSVQFQFQSEHKSEIEELIPQKSEDVRQQVLDRLREPRGRLQEVQGQDGQGRAQVGI